MTKVKNLIFTGAIVLAAFISTFFQIQNTSAYYSSYDYNSRPNYNYGNYYDRGYGIDGARIRVDLHDGVSYDYYRYLDKDPRYNPFYGYNYDYYYNNDFRYYPYRNYNNYGWRFNIPDEYKYNKNVAFLADSFNNRYEITSGKTSGQAFCQGCKDKNYDPTNFRYRPAYDPAVDSFGGYGDDGYYAPKKSPITGAWNWNY